MFKNLCQTLDKGWFVHYLCGWNLKKQNNLKLPCITSANAPSKTTISHNTGPGLRNTPRKSYQLSVFSYQLGVTS